MEYQAKKPGVTFSQVSTAYVVILGVDHPDVYSYQFINSLCLQMPPCFPSTAPQTSLESSNPWPNGDLQILLQPQGRCQYWLMPYRLLNTLKITLYKSTLSPEIIVLFSESEKHGYGVEES